MDLPEEILRQSIHRGSILLSDSFKEIDHAKFFVVMGVYDECIAGFFFINSRIHPIIESKPAHFAMQYVLRKKDYPFLRYDSFLGANELQTRPISVLVQSIQNRHTSIVGVLTETDMTTVLEECRNSDLFSPKEKLHFFS